jgi:hypothetical protein
MAYMGTKGQLSLTCAHTIYTQHIHLNTHIHTHKMYKSLKSRKLHQLKTRKNVLKISS